MLHCTFACLNVFHANGGGGISVGNNHLSLFEKPTFLFLQTSVLLHLLSKCNQLHSVMLKPSKFDLIFN